MYTCVNVKVYKKLLLLVGQLVLANKLNTFTLTVLWCHCQVVFTACFLQPECFWLWRHQERFIYMLSSTISSHPYVICLIPCRFWHPLWLVIIPVSWGLRLIIMAVIFWVRCKRSIVINKNYVLDQF